jgi:hypothetical protein
VFLTDDGHAKAENLLIEAGVLPEGVSLYDASNILLMQHINSALRGFQIINRLKFNRLSIRCTRHTRELVVESKIVLKGN